jgi:hypothetical protein
VPLQWTISHPQRLVLAVAKGEVAADEFSGYVAAIEAGQAAGYRKVFDISGLSGGLDDALLESIGRTVRDQARKHPIGPMAIVAASDDSYLQALAYVQHVAADRPLRIFRELHEARRWLDSLVDAPVSP